MTKPRKISTPGIYNDGKGGYYLKYKNKTYRGFKSVFDADLFKSSLKLSSDTIQSETFSVVTQSFITNEEHKVSTEEMTYGTYDKKRSMLDLYVLPRLKEYKLNKITPTVLRDFRNNIGQLSLSSSHKNYMLELVKQIFQYARKYYGLKEDLGIYLDRFPKTETERQKIKTRLAYVWNDADFDLFLSFVEESERAMMYWLFFKHGLRLGEAQALRWVDVDFKAKTISINGSITKKTKKKGIERKSTKTPESDRVIYVGKTTIKRLRALQDERKKLYGYKIDWYVSGTSKPITAREIDRRREYAYTHAKLPACTNHEMRHMFVTNAWSKVPIPALSKYIGHKNVAVTLDTYSHLAQQDERKFLDYIDKI